MTRSVFESLAWLFAPADDPGSCALVEAPADWQARLPADAPAIAWGRMPTRAPALARAVGNAVARERSIRGLQVRPGHLELWDVHRVAPIGWRPRWQRAVRQALLSGAIVRLGRGPAQPRVADRIAAEAGQPGGPVELRISGDGSARTHVAGSESRRVLLRLARVGGLKEAHRNRDALIRLGAAGVANVPRLQRSGTTLDVDWSTEDELAGAPVRALSPELLQQTVEWATGLPRSDGHATAVEERLEVLIRSFPRFAVELGRALERARERARDVPGVLEHGDLWAGNLLVAGGRLTGVVDWDNWHPAGVPGTDVLHLIAMAGRRRPTVELGELWLERPWQTAHFRSATGAYWSALGLAFDDDLAWLVAVSWWTAHVTAALRRGRQPAQDPRWVARNVENVAPVLAAR